MIGDGIAGFVKPRWHSLLWDIGPGPFRRAIEELAAHTAIARVFYGVEAALGLWLAESQTPEKAGIFE